MSPLIILSQKIPKIGHTPSQYCIIYSCFESVAPSAEQIRMIYKNIKVEKIKNLSHAQNNIISSMKQKW